LFTSEVLFKEINFVILKDTFGSSEAHFFSGLGETQVSFSVHFLKIFLNISWFSMINLSWPSSFIMVHSFRVGWNTFSVNAVLRKSSNVGEIQSVWISWNELFSTVWVWWNTTDDFGVGVFELGVTMSTKFLSLSHVGVSVCHRNN
jgi:hypothetical protein